MSIEPPDRVAHWTPDAERARRLQAWYDASTIRTISDPSGFAPQTSQWADRSALGRAATAVTSGSAPTHSVTRIAGRPVVRFPDTSERLIQSAGGAGPYNITTDKGWVVACVFRARTYSNGAATDGAGTYIFDRNVGGGNDNPIASLKAIGDEWRVQHRNDSGSGLTSLFVAPIVLGRPELVSFSYLDARASTALQTFSRGALAATGAAIGAITLSPIRFGYGGGNTGASDFDIAEYVVFNDGGDTRLRQRIEGYLAQKWEIPLAPGHPYASRALVLPSVMVLEVSNSVAGDVVTGVTSAGAISVSKPLAGTLSIAVTSAGAVDVAKPVAGASAIAITSAGAVSVEKPVAGASAVAITSAGAVTVDKPLAGGASVALTTAGALTLSGLNAATAIAVTSAGVVGVTKPVAGAMAVAVTSTADLSVAKPLAGAVALSVATAGAVDVAKPVAGNAVLALASSGAVGVTKPIAGGVSLSVTSAGAVTIGALASIEISASPTVFSIGQAGYGGNTIATITLVRGGGYNNDVTLAITGLPSGVSWGESVTPFDGVFSGVESVMNIRFSPNWAALPVTDRPFTITATGPSVAPAVILGRMSILDMQFSAIVSVDNAVASVARGGFVDFSFTRETFNGYLGLTTITAGALPPSVTASYPNGQYFSAFPSIPVVVVRLTADASALSTPTWPVVVTVESEGLANQLIPLVLTVTTPQIDIAAVESPYRVHRDDSVDVQVTLIRTQLTGPVTLVASGLPAGVVVSYLESATYTGNVVSILARFSIGPAVVLGKHVVTITAQAGSIASVVTPTIEVLEALPIREPGTRVRSRWWYFMLGRYRRR